MIRIRKSSERGHFNHGWLDTYHTFSFADYQDPAHMGFRKLRVINEDRVAPGIGFPTHSHRDMEIITVVLSGKVEHQDSMGNKTVIAPGEVQRMSAGTGVTHSEVNPSQTEVLHLLQIWILPEKQGLPPGYEQRAFSPAERLNRLCLAASRNPKKSALTLHQDVDLYISCLEEGKALEFALKNGRHAWLQMTAGILELNGHSLEAGDGAAISEEQSLKMRGLKQAEFLLFDLG